MRRRRRTARLDLPGDNWAFHRSLYRASGWTRGLAITEILHAAVAPYIVLYTEALGGAEDSDAEHAAILQACRDGDGVRARQLLLRHLDGASKALLAFLRAHEKTP